MLARENRAFAAGLAAKKPRPRLLMHARTLASAEFAPGSGGVRKSGLSEIALPNLKWAYRRAARTAKLSRSGAQLGRTA
jgi:hypothetical protein